MNATEPPAARINDQLILDLQKRGRLDGVSANLVAGLTRELSVSLADGRYGLTTLIGATDLISVRVRQMASNWRAEQTRSAMADSDADVIVDLAEKMMAVVAEECDYLQQRLEVLAAICASAIVTTRRSFQDVDAWESLPETLRSRREYVIDRLHAENANTSLVRSMSDPNSNLNAETLVDRLNRSVTPMVIDAMRSPVDPHRRSPEDVAEGPPLDRRGTPRGDSGRRAGDSIEATQQYRVPTRPRNGAVSIDDMVALVRPSLIDFGGSQRTVLIVGGEAQREPIEARIREHYDGPLTVAVIPGCEPTLIQEAQQIPMKSLLTRMEVMHGDTAAITGRLASRTDITF